MLWLDTIVKDAGLHFLFSGLAGLLAYSLTSITCTASLRLFGVGTYGNSLPKGVTFFIRFTALLAALLAALWLHSLLDSLLDWYRTPLGPPLDLGGL